MDLIIPDCPRCKSGDVIALNRGKKLAGTAGTVAGGSLGVYCAMGGARTGSVVGAVAGPLGSVVGSLAGALIGGAVGAISGGAAGAAVGEIVDEEILDNYQCLKCGHNFSEHQNE